MGWSPRTSAVFRLLSSSGPSSSSMSPTTPLTGTSSLRWRKRPSAALMPDRTTRFFLSLVLLWTVYCSVAAAADWVQDCRAAGFDPEQLACRTCALLPVSVQETCQECCASWLGEEMLRRPYQAAVLIDRDTAHGGGGGGEVADFLQQDGDDGWDAVVRAKGAHRLQHIVDDSTTRAGARQPLGNLIFVRKPSLLLFFDSTADVAPRSASSSPLSSSDVKRLVAAARESVNLDGLEKADLKDMLMTLLP